MNQQEASSLFQRLPEYIEPGSGNCEQFRGLGSSEEKKGPNCVSMCFVHWVQRLPEHSILGSGNFVELLQGFGVQEKKGRPKLNKQGVSSFGSETARAQCTGFREL